MTDVRNAYKSIIKHNNKTRSNVLTNLGKRKDTLSRHYDSSKNENREFPEGTCIITVGSLLKKRLMIVIYKGA